MKRILVILAVSLSLYSCQGRWTQSDKDSFYNACVDDTKKWVDDPGKVKTYCDCVMIKVLEKYPDVNDAIDNVETISRDPEIQQCRIPILK